eukprot:m.35352 g.35352  ORF g.35352 m.35352 type:complete len:66 (+) comp44045_c0_seq1:62-259(+)
MGDSVWLATFVVALFHNALFSYVEDFLLRISLFSSSDDFPFSFQRWCFDGFPLLTMLHASFLSFR